MLETICVLIFQYQEYFFKFYWTCFFFEILIPKVKPIAIGIFYRPPNANDFLDIFSNNLR